MRPPFFHPRKKVTRKTPAPRAPPYIPRPPTGRPDHGPSALRRVPTYWPEGAASQPAAHASTHHHMPAWALRGRPCASGECSSDIHRPVDRDYPWAISARKSGTGFFRHPLLPGMKKKTTCAHVAHVQSGGAWPCLGPHKTFTTSSRRACRQLCLTEDLALSLNVGANVPLRWVQVASALIIFHCSTALLLGLDEPAGGDCQACWQLAQTGCSTVLTARLVSSSITKSARFDTATFLYPQRLVDTRTGCIPSGKIITLCGLPASRLSGPHWLTSTWRI